MRNSYLYQSILLSLPDSSFISLFTVREAILFSRVARKHFYTRLYDARHATVAYRSPRCNASKYRRDIAQFTLLMSLIWKYIAVLREPCVLRGRVSLNATANCICELLFIDYEGSRCEARDYGLETVAFSAERARANGRELPISKGTGY